MIEINDDKYSRFELINWWKQDVLRNAKILVIGCGSLGNEIVKNLAMTGIGNIYVVDMDKVELTNLTRSVLFRKSDLGKSKAKTISKRAKEINDDISIKYFDKNVELLGLGVFGSMDVIICGLDNREARMFVNQSCRKMKKVWIDGAIEELSGLARVFSYEDESPCYECTMSETDYKIINKRKSCMMLGIDDIYEGKIPTTPTISSIIAGVETQEALKFLHNKDNPSLLKGKAFIFQGNSNDSYIIEYQVREDCLVHYSFDNILQLNKNFSEVTFEDIYLFGKEYFNDERFTIEFNNEIVHSVAGKRFFKDLNLLTQKDLMKNGKIQKPISFHNVNTGTELFKELYKRKLMDSAVPYNDILTLKCKDKRIYVQSEYFEIFKSTE